jgi:hypothetical protein
MDDNRFFKHATLLICSSLEIETVAVALSDVPCPVHMPADTITLNIYEPGNRRSLRYIAKADRRWR